MKEMAGIGKILIKGCDAKPLKKFEDIPGPFRLPFIGNLHLYKIGAYDFRDYHLVLLELRQRYGPLVREQIGFQKPVIHVFDPDDAETVYRNEDKSPHIFPLLETSKMYRKKREMSPGLGHTNGQEWYRLKNAIKNSMMKTASVEQFLPKTEAVTNDLIHVLKSYSDGRVPNLRNLLGRWSQEVAGFICLDKRLGYLRDGADLHLGTRIEESNREIFRLGAHLKFSAGFYKYFPTPKYKELVKNETFVYEIATKHIKEATSNLEKLLENGTFREGEFSFLSDLMRKDLTPKEVVIIAMSLYLDGLSTTVPTLMNNLYCLANNELAQKKAYDEICAMDKNNETSWQKFPYLKNVVKETFRMYPNGWEVARIPQTSITLSNYHIPAQTHLSLNMLVNYRSPEYFEEADKFKPERWERNGINRKIHPFLLTPFGHGARTCAGRKFAEQDLHVALRAILKHFRLSYPEENGPPLQLQFQTLLLPKTDLNIRFIPR